MDIFSHFEHRLEEAVEALKAKGVLPPDAGSKGVAVEPPREAGHGDLATNAAMVLAKSAKMKPRELAESLAAVMNGAEDIDKAEVAGPGFINLTLKKSFWPKVLQAILAAGENYGRGVIGQGQKVNVEYVSVNPTGPIHIGHCRGAVFGDALANLLAFAGYDVTREYYFNDGGAQVDVLARSAYLRYREVLGENIGEIPPGLYPGDYLKPVGEALAAGYGDSLLRMQENEWLPVVREKAIAMMMEDIRQDLATLGIRHDVFFNERSLIEGETDAVAATIGELKENGLIYRGVLPPPKGKLPEDWEPREQTLFRATQFGDDIDRPLIKSDGGYTYFASDMAYHRDKLRRGFKHMINVLGADHAGYVKRLQAAVQALSGGAAALDVRICQLVRLLRAAEPVKMSKRAGSFFTLREVVDEVGADAVRFMMLYRKNDAPLDFDFAKVTEQSRDNPVFYVQYAHTRAHSVFRMAQKEAPGIEIGGKQLSTARLDLLEDDSELSVIKRLSYFPRVIESAAQVHEPHRVAFYLYDLASDFHALWNRGTQSPHLRFIVGGNWEITRARLALVAAIAQIIQSGLGILGVQAIKEMR